MGNILSLIYIDPLCSLSQAVISSAFEACYAQNRCREIPTSVPRNHSERHGSACTTGFFHFIYLVFFQATRYDLLSCASKSLELTWFNIFYRFYLFLFSSCSMRFTSCSMVCKYNSSIFSKLSMANLDRSKL